MRIAIFLLCLIAAAAGESRKCFHGVPLIVPVEVDGALAEAADKDDGIWGPPLLDFLRNHRWHSALGTLLFCNFLSRINVNIRQVHS